MSKWTRCLTDFGSEAGSSTRPPPGGPTISAAPSSPALSSPPMAAAQNGPSASSYPSIRRPIQVASVMASTIVPRPDDAGWLAKPCTRHALASRAPVLDGQLLHGARLGQRAWGHFDVTGSGSVVTRVQAHDCGQPVGAALNAAPQRRCPIQFAAGPPCPAPTAAQITAVRDRTRRCQTYAR